MCPRAGSSSSRHPGAPQNQDLPVPAQLPRVPQSRELLTQHPRVGSTPSWHPGAPQSWDVLVLAPQNAPEPGAPSPSPSSPCAPEPGAPHPGTPEHPRVGSTRSRHPGAPQSWEILVLAPQSAPKPGAPGPSPDPLCARSREQPVPAPWSREQPVPTPQSAPKPGAPGPGIPEHPKPRRSHSQHPGARSAQSAAAPARGPFRSPLPGARARGGSAVERGRRLQEQEDEDEEEEEEEEDSLSSVGTEDRPGPQPLLGPSTILALKLGFCSIISPFPGASAAKRVTPQAALTSRNPAPRQNFPILYSRFCTKASVQLCCSSKRCSSSQTR
nr:uncharacterized protein LOC112995671 [Dromaius novaehollandiae]